MIDILKIITWFVRPCYRPIIKFKTESPDLTQNVPRPLSLPPWVVYDETIIEWFF